jgi:hypothetical protein
MSAINAGPTTGPGPGTGINLNTSRKLAMSDSNKTRGGFNYIINSMLLIAIVGMCIKIFFTSNPTRDGKSGPANAVIYGYGIVALSILTVLFISYGIHERIGRIQNKGKIITILSFLKSFLTSSLPSILTIMVLLWVISLNISYYTNINKGMVAEEFYQLTNATTYLFVFQLICLFQYLKLFINIKTGTSENKIEDEKSMGRISFATYFMTTINLIVVGMMTIILQFFSTDG